MQRENKAGKGEGGKKKQKIQGHSTKKQFKNMEDQNTQGHSMKNKSGA